MENKIIKRNLVNGLTKMNTLILNELSKGKSYKMIYETLHESGYKIKNEEAVRAIVRKLKKKYKVKTLFHLGFYYGIDIYNPPSFKELQKALDDSVNERIKCIEKCRELNDELSKKHITISSLNEALEESNNRREEERVIAYEKAKEAEEEFNISISKRYARGRIEGRQEQKQRTAMYMLMASVFGTLLIILIIFYCAQHGNCS